MHYSNYLVLVNEVRAIIVLLLVSFSHRSYLTPNQELHMMLVVLFAVHLCQYLL